MFKKERDEVLLKIGEHYGIKNRIEMLIEECEELIQTAQNIERYPRYNRYTDDIWTIGCFFEELASVQIIIDQIKLLATQDDCDHFRREYYKKLDLQLKQIEKR